ncbi:MAG: hypothetical protein ACE5H4_07930 [Candidatus Thorarchaeota archaeon]
MGIFDRWRRKKKPEEKSRVRAREIMTSKGPVPITSPRPTLEALGPEDSSEVNALLSERRDLLQRRRELQQKRTDLTARLDNGELEPSEFRKQLMSMIQEASQVSDNLRDNASKLNALGHPVAAM